MPSCLLLESVVLLIINVKRHAIDRMRANSPKRMKEFVWF